MQSLEEKINALLPQTQCRDCEYESCQAYADAIVNQGESIDRCAPGGIEVLNALAEALEIDPAPFRENVLRNARAPSVVKIREDECIGCTKCIQACPVDAIIGAAKQMHVIIQTECTGCELCISPCPMDCIDIIDIRAATFDKTRAEKRYLARNKRLSQREQTKVKMNSQQKKRDYIAKAIARSKQKKSEHLGCEHE